MPMTRQQARNQAIDNDEASPSAAGCRQVFVRRRQVVSGQIAGFRKEVSSNVRKKRLQKLIGDGGRARGLNKQAGVQTSTLAHAQPRMAEHLDQVAEEVPVALVYNGISHAVMMASPVHLEDFALGFTLSEGIVQAPHQIYSLDVVPQQQGIEVRLEIGTEWMAKLKERRRTLAGRTGCGICGTESLQQAVRPVACMARQELPADAALQLAVTELYRWQPMQTLTGAFHGAAWCNGKGQIQFLREDIGRHNALDKLIGVLSQRKVKSIDGFVLVSSRASYEMVQKAASVGIPTLVAISAPTALAIDLAQESGLNLVGFARQGRHVIYTH